MTYLLSFPDRIRSRLMQLQDKVLAMGMGKELARMLSTLTDDLSNRPLEVGEILYELRHQSMPVKSHVKEYLSVVFVVHEASKRVMVTRLKMLSQHPFPKGYEKFLNE